MKPMNKSGALLICSILLLSLPAYASYLDGMAGSDDPNKVLETMGPGEREFCTNVLWQIRDDWSKDRVVHLLGTPSRDLGLKVNWWVTLDGKPIRVGVYFTLSGLAEQVVLDGGPDRFYYRRPVTDHMKAPPVSETKPPTRP